jgi:predicted nucleic-acid-binding protein
LKNRQAGLRALLDTPFLLPTIGIDVGEEVLTALKKLDSIKAEIYYSRFSILETLWLAARLSKNMSFDNERFIRGLRSIIEGGRYVKVEESSEIFEEALRMYGLGHRDMIDNILYATSSSLNINLLTLDRELKQFISDKKLKDIIILPDQMTL